MNMTTWAAIIKAVKAWLKYALPGAKEREARRHATKPPVALALLLAASLALCAGCASLVHGYDHSVIGLSWLLGINQQGTTQTTSSTNSVSP